MMLRRNNIQQTRKRRKTALVAFLFCVFFFNACTVESYDSGDGDLSYLRADFVMAHTDKDGAIDYAIDDNGQRIDLKSTVTPKWTTTKDSLYRGLLYYNDKPGGAEAITLSMVYVLQPRDTSQIEKPVFDPVDFESAWVSANGSFLNLGFSVKTGQTDDDVRQSIGILSSLDADGTLLLTLIHDQADVPQYYSSRAYASIPLTSEMRQRPLRLVVNTYAGTVVKDFLVTSPADGR